MKNGTPADLPLMRATKIRKSLNYLDTETNSAPKSQKGNIVLRKVRAFAKERNLLNLADKTVANESEKQSSIFFRGKASKEQSA